MVVNQVGSSHNRIRSVDLDPLHRPLKLAVPNLHSYSPHSGIGRVIGNLQEHWGHRAELSSATFRSVPLPILRNDPIGVDAPSDTDLILVPQLTGAQGVRNTAGIPSVVIVHDVGIVDCPEDREGLSRVSAWNIRRSLKALRRVDHVVCVSEFTRSRLLRHVPEVADRVTVIYDGVGDIFLEFGGTRQDSRSIIESIIQRKLRSLLLIHVGSEHPRKNIATLLGTLKKVQAAIPDAQLLKIGRAGNPLWRERTLQRARAYDLQPGDDIIFLEGVTDEVLAHAYRAADVFVTASLYEGFGLPALESMAVGTPVVVSNRGALPEVVGAGGWIAEPDDLSSAVCTALETAGERAQVARDRAASLKWSLSADKYLETFNGLLGRDNWQRSVCDQDQVREVPGKR